MNKIKVFVESPNNLDYIDLFKGKKGFSIEEDIEYADIVCFTGGSDISPAIYSPHQSLNYLSKYSLARDRKERDTFRFCQNVGIPMVGICRGAQLGCVLSGGNLFQHVANHFTGHEILLSDSRKIMVSSSHHQMMKTDNVEHILLGYTLPLSNTHVIFDQKRGLIEIPPPEKEPEIVFFPKTKFLSHQPHPEWMDRDSEYYRYFFETVHDFLLRK